MKKFILIALMVLLVGGLTFGACAKPAPAPPAPAPAPAPAPPAPAPAPKVFELTMGTMHPPEGSMNKLFLAWFNWLEEASEGRLKMTLLPAAQAAAPPDLYDAARTGIVDIADAHVGMSPGRFPLMEVIDLPFIFKTPAARATGLTCLALLQKYPEIQSEFSDVKPLYFHFTDAAQIWTIKKQVKTLDDMKGLLLLSTSKGGTESLKLLGASPQRSDPGSDYDMLAKKVVDGHCINYEAVIVTFKFIDVLNYCTEVGLSDAQFIVVMNPNTWNSLPADLQQLFVGDNAKRMTELMGYDFDNWTISSRSETEKTFKERGYPGIYVLPEAEKAKWVEVVMPVLEQWVKQAAAIVGEAKARAILEDAKKFAEQYRYETTPFDQCKQTLRDWGHPVYAK